MAKELRCSDVMGDCAYVVRGATEEEVLAHAAVHAREVHGMDEIDEAVERQVRSVIRDVESSS